MSSTPIQPVQSLQPSKPWSHDPRLVDLHTRYRWYLVHGERNSMAGKVGMSDAQVEQLYKEVEAEIAANPATYPGEFMLRSEIAKVAAWWRKCDAVCDYPGGRLARTSKEHMIQWWVGSMAIQFISFCELDDEDDVHDQLLADAAAEAMTVLNPHPQPYEPPVDTLAAPDLLDWVGSSFRERGTRAKYFVEDAGMSIARG
ncbi:hypothetical protein FA95DRAFT_1606993, partial [Auriscalpium vulgare]